MINIINSPVSVALVCALGKVDDPVRQVYELIYILIIKCHIKI